MKKLQYLPWIIGFGLLMENLDISILNTAIPQMAIALHSYPITLKIAVTSYLLTLAAFIPISGYIADTYGAKKTFSWAMVIFLLGSALCGCSHNVLELVLGRLIQGVGGAMMTPVGRLILLRTFSKQEFVKAFTSLTLLGQTSLAFGPVLGGILTSFYSWRWVFFINIPLGVLAIVLIHYFVDEIKKEHRASFDFFGFGLFSIGAGALTFGLSMLAEQAPHKILALLVLLTGLLALLGFYAHARKTKHPSLDLELFKVRTFRISVWGGLLIRLAIGGIPFLLPLLFQVAWSFSAFISGVLILPYGLAMVVTKSYVKKVLHTYGFRKVLLVNPICIALTYWVLSLAIEQHNLWLLMPVIFLLGTFSSLQFTCMNILNFVDIKDGDAAKATSLSSVFQQMATSFGVCMIAFLLIGFNHGEITQVISVRAFVYAGLSLGGISLLCLYLFKNLVAEDGKNMIR